MNEWMYYGLIAALFISLKDLLVTSLIKKYNYIDLVITSNIIIFIFTIIYLIYSKQKINKIEIKDIFKMILEIFLIYLIINPSIYKSIKKSTNTGNAKGIINLNSAITFILAIIFFNSEKNYRNMVIMISIIILSLLLK